MREYTQQEKNDIVREWLFDEVRTERVRQDKKWGEQNHGDDYWLGIFVEEVGEIAKAVIERKDDEITTEVIHAIAVLSGWTECRQRRPSDTLEEVEA